MAALCFVVAPPALAQRAAERTQGWVFRYTTTPSASGRPMAGGDLVLDVAVWQGVARVTVVAGPLRALTGENGTLLLRAADSSLAIVNPARRDVLRASAGDLSSILTGPSGAAQLEITDVRSVTKSRGAGERLLRYRTRRVDVQQQYTLRVRAGTAQRTLLTTQTIELTLSPEIARLDPAFALFAEQFVRSLGLPGVLRMKLREAERGTDGFPVRILSRSSTVAGTDTLQAETRGAASLLRRETVDTTTFVAPAAYRVTELNRLQQRRQP